MQAIPTLGPIENTRTYFGSQGYSQLQENSLVFHFLGLSGSEEVEDTDFAEDDEEDDVDEAEEDSCP